MRIGLMHGARREQTTLAESVEQAVSAEAEGFDSVWFPQLPTFGFDALTVIALAGVKTKRIALGTAVLPTFPTHPLAMAKQALTAQVACGGRLTLGLGLSHKPMIENAMGLSYDSPALHMREYLTVTKALIDSGGVDFEGQVFQVKAHLTVNEAPQVPIVIAALAPRMLRMAGELVDGTATWMAGVKTIGEHIVPRIQPAAQSAGRPQSVWCLGVKSRSLRARIPRQRFNSDTSATESINRRRCPRMRSRFNRNRSSSFTMIMTPVLLSSPKKPSSVGLRAASCRNAAS